MAPGTDLARPFANREEGGAALARLLTGRGDPDPVVVALPRGGVPVGAVVATALGAPLDVIVVRKLGVPSQPELAMGAIGEDGTVVLNREVIDALRISEADLARSSIGAVGAGAAIPAVAGGAPARAAARPDRHPGRRRPRDREHRARGDRGGARRGRAAGRRRGAGGAGRDRERALTRGRRDRLRGDAGTVLRDRSVVPRLPADHRRRSGGAAQPLSAPAVRAATSRPGPPAVGGSDARGTPARADTVAAVDARSASRS